MSLLSISEATEPASVARSLRYQLNGRAARLSFGRLLSRLDSSCDGGVLSVNFGVRATLRLNTPITLRADAAAEAQRTGASAPG